MGTAPDIGAFEYEGYGFTLIADPSSRAIAPGGVATYTIGVQPVGGFSGTVGLVAASPSPSLALTLSPAAIAPGAVAALTLADAHAGTLLPGLWYSVAITGTGGGVTQTTSVGLLVGGTRVWLPVILRGCP